MEFHDFRYELQNIIFDNTELRETMCGSETDTDGTHEAIDTIAKLLLEKFTITPKE